MPFTKRITIERNRNGDDLQCAGSIAGETEDGRRWIMFLDADGAPEVYWPKRDEDGAVIGASIGLQDKRIAKFLEIMSDPDPIASATRLKAACEAALKMLNAKKDDGEKLVSTFPVFTPETWPRKPGDSPTDYVGLQRGVVMCVAQDGENHQDAMRRFVKELDEYYEAEERTSGE